MPVRPSLERMMTGKDVNVVVGAEGSEEVPGVLMADGVDGHGAKMIEKDLHGIIEAAPGVHHGIEVDHGLAKIFDHTVLQEDHL